MHIKLSIVLRLIWQKSWSKILLGLQLVHPRLILLKGYDTVPFMVYQDQEAHRPYRCFEQTTAGNIISCSAMSFFPQELNIIFPQTVAVLVKSGGKRIMHSMVAPPLMKANFIFFRTFLLYLSA